MKKKEFVARTTALLRSKQERKHMYAAKHTFHISDDDGNSKDFVVKKAVKGILYNNRDVGLIVDACIEVILEALRHGEPIELRGIGELSVKYRNVGRRLSRATGEWIYVDGKYMPKFRAFTELKKCAAVYQAAVQDGTLTPLPPWSVYKDTDEEEADWEGGDDGETPDGTEDNRAVENETDGE